MKHLSSVRPALVVGALLLGGGGCGSLTGLNDLEADPDFDGAGGSSGAGGSGGTPGCVEAEEVDKVGVMLLVEGGIPEGTRTTLQTALLAPNPALSELHIGFDFFPEPGGPTCGAPLIAERPVLPPNRHSDPFFEQDVAQFFDVLDFVPEGPDAPEQALRYASREFARTPSFQAGAAVVLTGAQVQGCDPSWALSASTATTMLTSPPFLRTYVVSLPPIADHTLGLATAGGTEAFDNLPAPDLQLALEYIAGELKECTLFVSDAPTARLFFDGDQLPFTTAEACTENGSDGYFAIGTDRIGLCPVTCAELLDKKAAEDPDAEVYICAE